MNGHAHITDCGLTGIKAIPYGLHMCHFYEKREELSATLVPYLVAGLQKNERCIWITAEPLDARAAEAELAAAGLSMPAMARNGSLLIRDHSDWYGQDGSLDPDKIIARWLEEERRALDEGYVGLRIAGNTAFVKPGDWSAFMDYEQRVDETFANRRIVTLCSYLLDRRAATDVLDVARRHSCTLERPDEGWQILTARQDLEFSDASARARTPPRSAA
jgi:two-component system, sensor histidine kinase PdtaS